MPAYFLSSDATATANQTLAFNFELVIKAVNKFRTSMGRSKGTSNDVYQLQDLLRPKRVL